MGFNKRYITQKGILENISDLEKYLKADALIMDMWSSRFCDDLNPKERKLREDLKKDTMFWSGGLEKHPNFSKLDSLSEMIIALKTDPTWTDILLTIKKLNIPIDQDERGKFEILREKSIKYIIDYYEK